MEFREALVADSRKNDPGTQKAINFAKDEFRPLYFIHMYDQDPKKIEMSFDLTHYQPQFKVLKIGILRYVVCIEPIFIGRASHRTCR